MPGPNRLAAETSPYLRQHADNPVEWYPWGEEAFDEAQRLDRPLLISVGYSACHWCHVMAHESFEDPDTASLMNELFINIKVDREERPDVDAIYMEAVQAMTGRGGWPMTVFATADGRPFFAGTYFPRERRGQAMTFTELCHRIDAVWRDRRDDIDEQATAVTEAIGQASELSPAAQLPGTALVDRAIELIRAAHDERLGGFGTAPKFPQTMTLDLLLAHHHRSGDADVLEIVTRSLDAMAAGGIYDHLGGGFARYSVDEQWLVPHFEKMLYDQALLVRAYLHAWQVTDSELYAQVLDETITYVLRDLRQPLGGFASAEDADSDDGTGTTREGWFYAWTEHDLRATLAEHGFDPDQIDEVIQWWGVRTPGTFEDDLCVLHRPDHEVWQRPEVVERARRILFAERSATRARPGLDDKVLTEWNALFLSSLAEAAAVADRSDWREAAVRCANFLVEHLRREDGRWLRSWQGDTTTSGSARHLAYAADHAALVDAFVRVHELTGDPRWLTEATTVAEALIELFWDDDNGGVFTTGGDAPALVTRPKDVMDNATPSANSLTAHALLRLGALTGDDDLRARAEVILRLLGEPAARHPLAFAHLIGAAALEADGLREVVISGERNDLVDAVQRRHLPDVVLTWGEPTDGPLWEGRRERGADGRAYVCEGFVCRAPASDVAGLEAALGERPPG